MSKRTNIVNYGLIIYLPVLSMKPHLPASITGARPSVKGRIKLRIDYIFASLVDETIFISCFNRSRYSVPVQDMPRCHRT